MTPEEVAALARKLASDKANTQASELLTSMTSALPDRAKGSKARVESAVEVEKVKQSASPGGAKTPVKSGEYTEEQFKEFLQPSNKYKLVEFADPAELLYTVDSNFRDGTKDLYDWQIEIHELVNKYKFTQLHPLRFLLRAANGSGKDAYITAPFAVWFALCKIRSRVIITSSSYQQLETQTESYIRTLCQQVNEFFGEEVFYIRKLHIVCKWTGSEIKMFSTDDPGRAEGYHPFPDYANAEMAIIINEAKTLPDVIFDALGRCTGFNYWLEVSSPGQTSGHFYKEVSNAVEYTKDTPYVKGGALTKQVTAYQCSHFSFEEIERDAETYGRSSGWFRSKRLAEFTTLDESVVISKEIIDSALRKNTQHLRVKGEVSNKKCGVDLGFSKDETVAFVIDGNKILDMVSFVINDTTAQVERLCMFFEKHGLKGEDIAVDDSNFGHSVNDMLKLRGYDVRRQLNQQRAYSTRVYGNRGAEMWFNFKRLLELGYVHGLDRIKHKLVIEQLCNRYYKQTESNGKIMLESKKEARAAGHGSPDRADALVLAFSFYNVNDFLEDAESVEQVVLRNKNKGKLAADFAQHYEETVTYRSLNSTGTGNATDSNERPKIGIIPTCSGLVKRRLGRDKVNSINKQFKSSLYT